MPEDTLLSKQLLDDETVLRKQGDQRVSIYIGQSLSQSSEPTQALPSYTSLIDLVNSESLHDSLQRLDRGKNSVQTVTTLDGTTVVNPKSVSASTNTGSFGLYPTGNGYRININTISSAPYVRSIQLLYGTVSAIGASRMVVSGITYYSERVELAPRMTQALRDAADAFANQRSVVQY